MTKASRQSLKKPFRALFYGQRLSHAITHIHLPEDPLFHSRAAPDGMANQMPIHRSGLFFFMEIGYDSIQKCANQ
jgi:hypothetical protein